jgi:hypothetical protein
MLNLLNYDLLKLVMKESKKLLIQKDLLIELEQIDKEWDIVRSGYNKE